MPQLSILVKVWINVIWTHIHDSCRPSHKCSFDLYRKCNFLPWKLLCIQHNSIYGTFTITHTHTHTYTHTHTHMHTHMHAHATHTLIMTHNITREILLIVNNSIDTIAVFTIAMATSSHYIIQSHIGQWHRSNLLNDLLSCLPLLPVLLPPVQLSRLPSSYI